jgi:hypothetical protein
MATWKTLKPAQKKAAGQVFDALSTLDALTETDNEATTGGQIGFSDIYAFATNPAHAMDNRMREALLRNPRLRRDLDKMIANAPVYHFRRVAAASSGDIDSRESDGFKIRLKQSRAEETQTYVIIELAEGAPKAPTMLFVRDAGEDYIKQALPEPQDGVIQLLVESDSDLVKALRDIQTEVFIR